MEQKLILGTVQLGISYGVNNFVGKPSKEKAFGILNKASEYGINILDTADAYGDAIEIISAFHKEHAPFEIITKFIHRKDTDLEKYINELLVKLNIPHLYAMMFHRYSDLIRYPELLPLLTIQKNKDKIKYIGVSVYSNEEFAHCVFNQNIDLIQLPFSLLDNNFQRGELLKKAKAENKIIHTRSVFLQGLFFKDINTFPESLQPLKKYIVELNEIAKKYNYTMQELALNYVLHTPEIDHVLFGIETIEQLNQNVRAVHTSFSSELYERINKIVVKEGKLLNPSNWN